MPADSPIPPDDQVSCSDDDERTFTSEQILRGRREVLIRHGNEIYRLRLTRQGKLILQK